MTNPKPERVCANCEFYQDAYSAYVGRPGGQCVVTHHMPHPFLVYEFHDMPETGTCVLFRAREES